MGFLNFEFRLLIEGEFIPWIGADRRGLPRIAAGERFVVVTSRSASGATLVYRSPGRSQRRNNVGKTE
jgi:hypothetical protein